MASGARGFPPEPVPAGRKDDSTGTSISLLEQGLGSLRTSSGIRPRTKACAPEGTPQCSCGLAKETVEHVLMECARWEDKRTDMRFELSDKDVSMALSCDELLTHRDAVGPVAGLWCGLACWGSSAGWTIKRWGWNQAIQTAIRTAIQRRVIRTAF